MQVLKDSSNMTVSYKACYMHVYKWILFLFHGLFRGPYVIILISIVVIR